MPYRWFGCSSHDTDDVRFLRITFDFSFVTDLPRFGIAPWSCWIVPRDRLRVHEVICSCELPSNFDIDELDRLIGVCPLYVCTASSCRCICSCVAGISNSKLSRGLLMSSVHIHDRDFSGTCCCTSMRPSVGWAHGCACPFGQLCDSQSPAITTKV